MKRISYFKNVQITLLVILSAISLFIIFTDQELFHLAATNIHIKLLCGMLWLILAISFIFIFFDIMHCSMIKKEHTELDLAVHSEPHSGIANRYSCDTVIEKYLDKPLPSNISCIMIELSNIATINKEHGHLKGNLAIRDFSNILKLASIDLCFVGRNGGNKFLAIFEKGSYETLKQFLLRIHKKTTEYNSNEENISIEYKYGAAAYAKDSDIVDTITELIALSNKRLHNS